MQLDELMTAAEVRERARQVSMRLRAQHERKVMPYAERGPDAHNATPVEMPEPAVSAGAVMAPAKIRFPQRPEATVMRIVGARYGVKPDALKGSMRSRPMVSYRHRAIWIVRMLFGRDRSLPRIGRVFGDRDHTTIMHAVRSIEAKRALDPALSAELDALLGQCRAAIHGTAP